MPETDASRLLSRFRAALDWRARVRPGVALHRLLHHRVISLRPATKAALLWSADMAVPPLCLFVALGLAEGTLRPVAGKSLLWVLAAGLALLAGVISAALGLPRIKLKAYETRGLTRTAIFALLVAAAGLTLARESAPRCPPICG